MFNLVVWTLGAFVWWFCYTLSTPDSMFSTEVDLVLAVMYTVGAAYFWVRRFPLR